jgi:hypothetical protein
MDEQTDLNGFSVRRGGLPRLVEVGLIVHTRPLMVSYAPHVRTGYPLLWIALRAGFRAVQTDRLRGLLPAPSRRLALLPHHRLRKAILHAIANSRANEHDISSRLNENMMAKVSATRNLREDLHSQLERVRDEQTRAKGQRAALAAALEAKRGPLAQARERLAVRVAAGGAVGERWPV